MRASVLTVSVLTVALAGGCGRGRDDGLVKYQVSGSVRINGELQKGVAIVFNHTDPGVTANAARPVAVTNEAGEFQISTNGPADGAVEGTYIVTFFWPEGGASSRDFLKGKYVRQEASTFRVTIDPENTLLPPFDLEAPPTDVLEAQQILSGAAARAPQS